MLLETITECLHDISNKLSCILGTTTLLRRNRCEDCANASLVDSIRESGLAMGDIIAGCRKHLRECKGGELTRLDIYDVFQQDKISQEACKFGLEFRLEVEFVNKMSLGCSILVTATILDSYKKVLNNLFFNAKKANATKIRIVGVEHPSYVAFHVIDNGDGMSAETLSCLGLSVASSTSTGEGTRIVNFLTSQEGAVVEWSSPGIGAGCCVTIRFTKYKEAV